MIMIRSRYGRKDWTIMCASQWISGKPSIEKIAVENGRGPATIIVAKRDGKSVFILGSGMSGYGNKGETKTYVKDTGNGYKGEGECLIENIITIDKEGICNYGNGIGANEKRALYVFK